MQQTYPIHMYLLNSEQWHKISNTCMCLSLQNETLHLVPGNASKVALIQQVDKKLIAIPVVFIFLRMWGTLEFIVTESSCNPGPAIAGFLSALRFLQVMFILMGHLPA